ncbi:MAG TPA: ECF RNA polymerase sigma factor SigK [Ornithinimicrobium sp.]|nr:ECF RNA polymerase sigma factor SigK [Ornithinimicrobium sp.]
MGPPQGAGSLLSPATADPTDLATLLLRVAAQDQPAFADLYDAVAARVHGLALRVLRNPTMAEDVTQEVFLQVWREAAGFDPARGSALAWLMTLAHRRAVDRVRSEEAQSARLHRYESLQTTVPFDSTAEAGELRWEAARVRRAIDTVGEPHRTTLILAYFEGLTHREVAERTQVPLGTAKTRIRDGLRKMRQVMAGGEQG